MIHPPTMQGADPPAGALSGLDPAGLLRGVLGAPGGSWPAEGPVDWSPPDDAEVQDMFPGFTEIRMLGRGGMGAVYQARQISLDRQVALKILPAELSRDPSAAERFRREAKALARLNHPNIVAIHDFGETRGASFYFVMEHVDGPDLHQLIQRGPLPLPQALDIIRQICDALEFAHAQGFVHRDIKPSNILIDANGRVKVSDFGLAMLMNEKNSDANAPSPTLTRAMVGTPEYVAPEQRRGDADIDHRADLYSLGVMFYEMLTGSLPCGAFEPPSSRADIGRNVDRVVIRAMQAEPDKRYQQASDVRQDLHHVESFIPRKTWIAACLVLIAATALSAWMLSPGAGSDSHSFTNSLGMKFREVGNQGVWFSTIETRRSDFSKFVEETGHVSAGKVHWVKDAKWQTAEASWQVPPGLPAQNGDHPVACVSQADAEAFCAWLTRRERESGRIDATDSYRLPTRPEWLATIGHANGETDAIDLNAVFVLKPGPIQPLISNTIPDQPADLIDNLAEWTSSPGMDANHRLVVGSSWLEIPPSHPSQAVRSYDRGLRGVGIGFRIVLERKTPSNQP
jgi:serine/threonine protein kinase